MYLVGCLHLYINNKTMTEDKLYSAIENAIIKWVINGTRTAGSLTREIMLIIKQQQDEEIKQV